MLRRSGILRMACVVVAALGVLPATGSAIAVPADAPVIAGAWDSGQSAIVFARGGQVCMAFQAVGAPRPARLDDNGACADTPVLGPFGRETIAARLDGRRYVELGVVGAATARVQLRDGGAVVASTATQPSSLPGAAAPLRFYVLTAPAEARADEVALLDTFDTVMRAIDPVAQEAAGPDGPYAGEPPAPGPVLRRGTFHGRAWTLRTRIGRSISGTPLLPERRPAMACAAFSTAGSVDEVCDQDARSREAVLAATDAQCGAVGRVITVLARRAVRRVVVVDGTGRRRAVTLGAVPGATDGMRAGALVLGIGLAVRRVEALGAGGRALERLRLELEPVMAPLSCQGAGSSANLISSDETITVLGPLGSGPHTARFADDGLRLCVAIDRAPRLSDDCAIPPTDAGQASLSATPTADGRYVAGLVPREVALARLVLEGGGHRDVVALPVTGQYAGLTKLVAVDVPGPRHVIGFRLLDDAGRALKSDDDGPEQPAPRHRTTLLAHAAPGLGPIVAAQEPSRHGTGPIPCVTTLGADSEQDCRTALPGYAVATVLCAPRRILVVGALHRAAQRLVIRTASGRDVTARTLRLPAVLRRPPNPALGLSGTAAIAVAVLRPDQAPRRLLRRGPDAKAVGFTLPPAREQCGYETTVELTDPFG
jgi:hypothetical protein